MPNADRKHERMAESTLAMVAEMQRINDEIHHIGEETLSRLNALLRAEASQAQPHPDEDEGHEHRRSA